MKNLITFLKSEDGPTATEYAVMLALIIVVSVALVQSMGQKVSQNFSKINSGF